MSFLEIFDWSYFGFSPTREWSWICSYDPLKDRYRPISSHWLACTCIQGVTHMDLPVRSALVSRGFECCLIHFTESTLSVNSWDSDGPFTRKVFFFFYFYHVGSKSAELLVLSFWKTSLVLHHDKVVLCPHPHSCRRSFKMFTLIRIPFFFLFFQSSVAVK